jgi:acetoin utilization protein AcuC
MIYFYYTDGFMGYSFGPEHPLQPARLMLTSRLIDEYGFIPDIDAERVEPSAAMRSQLKMVHTEEYIDAVEAEACDPAFGLAEDDNPAFPGMYYSAALIAGSCIEGAKRIAEEGGKAFCVAGGLHHAFPSRASGFCIFNDCALGIAELRKHFKRVLYIDIDAHHGDGVQNVFYSDPSVLTISIHESGKYLFPGTGFVDEVGEGDGIGYSVNLPMPIYSGDGEYIRAFDEIVPPLFEWFKPEAVVAQLGVDTHYSDPLTSLNLTLYGYRYLVSRIKELTDTYSEGRMLALGGGGYNLELVPVAWSQVFQILRGKELPLDPPSWWSKTITGISGRPPLYIPDIRIVAAHEDELRLSVELDGTMSALQSRIRDIHGIF